jgi:hypothetical protein
MYEDTDYRSIDPRITQWAKRHDVVFEREYKGYAVRSFWLRDVLQFWIDAADAEGYVRVHLAELKPDLPSKWGRSLEWRTTESQLSDCLDEVWSIGNRWL